MFNKADNFFKVKPFDHQLETLNRIKDKAFYALFWEMGTGKTFELIHVLRYLYCLNEKIRYTLIICPKAVCYNWKKELIMFSPNPDIKDSIAVLDGTKKERLEMFNDPKKKIFIVNYEGVGRIKEVADTLAKYQWSAMILDEAQRIKNYKAAQTKEILRISKNALRRYIATGTPILNSLMDIFTLYLFLDGGERFGTNYHQFVNRYFTDKNIGWRGSPKYFPDWRARKDKITEIQAKIYSCADRKLKEDCLDLPPKIYETYYVEMDPAQKKMYEQLKNELITFFNNEAVIASTALTKILRLNQITSGFVAVDGEEGESGIRNISDSKLKALVELVNDIMPNKVIIWAWFRNDIKRISEALKKYKPAVVYGGVSGEERENAIHNFQNKEDCKVFIGQQRACGLGITLTKASYAIYYSQNYSLEDRLQSEDRCHRAGSERHAKITYIDLVCRDTVDEVIIKALQNKEDLAKNVLDKVQLLLGGISLNG